MPDPNPTAPKSANDSAETPEDVATLYSWANLHGAKYRDFSASRAQAREEARQRAEEAAAAERRRQEEEAERRRQEEAQIAAREAAEAAEAARQAEAERLAEIARQAEVERQAVLAAQEAQRQAVMQRGWQSPPSEAYSGGYNAASNVLPGITESFEYHPPAPEPAFNPTASESPNSSFSVPGFSGLAFSGSDRISDPSVTAHDPAARIGAPVPVPSSNAPSSPAFAAPVPASRATPAYPAASYPAGYGEPAPSYAESPASVQSAEESYLPSPWLTISDERESRDLNVGPSWLAPETLPAVPHRFAEPTHAPPAQAPAKPVPMYAQSLSQSSYGVPAPQSTGAQNPNRPGWSQPATNQPATNQPAISPSLPAQPSPYLPAAPSASPIVPSAYPAPAYPVPTDDALTGSRDRGASRWFALKNVFDPQSAPVEQAPSAPPARVPVLAVFSLAGGVGKTSLVASLGRSLSSRGERILLVDTAPYGLLPFFFGARDQRPGQLRTFNPPGVSLEAPIQLVTLDPDAPPQEAHDPQQGQHAADRAPNPDWLAQEILRLSRTANRILIDLPTASGAATRRVLRLNPTILVPVVPDMNSVVSVGAIESFFRHNGSAAGKPIMPYYVLNQFDYSLPLHLDVREILREQIGDRLLPFALRRSPAVSEALAEGMTVIDYAPSAVLAEDYASLAGWVRSLSAPATQTYRGVRWSER